MLTVSLKKLLLPSLVLAHVLFGALQEATTLPHPKSFQSRAGNLHSCSWKFQITEGYAGKYTELRLLLFRLTFFGMMKGLVNHYETLSWVLASGNPQRQIILLFGDSGLSVRTTKQSSKANFSWHSVFYFCIPKIISTLKKKKAYPYTLPKLLWKGKSEIQFPKWKSQMVLLYSILSGRIKGVEHENGQQRGIWSLGITGKNDPTGSSWSQRHLHCAYMFNPEKNDGN